MDTIKKEVIITQEEVKNSIEAYLLDPTPAKIEAVLANERLEDIIGYAFDNNIYDFLQECISEALTELSIDEE